MSILLEAQKRQQQGDSGEQVYAASDSSEYAASNNKALVYASAAVAASVVFAAIAWVLTTNNQSVPTKSDENLAANTKQQVTTQPKLVAKNVEHTVVLGDLDLANTTKVEKRPVEIIQPAEKAIEPPSSKQPTLIDSEKRIRPIQTERAEELDIDPMLLAKFNAAVKQTMNEEQTQSGSTSNNQSTASAFNQTKPLVNYPESFQARIPKLDFQTHIYSSEAKQRWVKVNGKIVREEQDITEGLTVIEIKPQQVVLSYSGERFSLPALTSWQY